MAAARVDESCSSFDLTDHNIGLEPRLNTSKPLSMKEDKNSRKFKRQSGFNELKSFVNDEVSLKIVFCVQEWWISRLEGEWCHAFFFP